MQTTANKTHSDNAYTMNRYLEKVATNKNLDNTINNLGNKHTSNILADLAIRSSTMNSLTSGECFAPQLVASSGSQSLTQDQINALMNKSAALAVLLANILGIKSKTIANMAQLEQEIFNIMNQMAAMNREFAQEIGNKLEADAKDAENKIKKAEEKAAKASFWSSLFGFILGAIITVFSGGMGAAIGVTLMVSSAVSLGIGAYAMGHLDQVFGNSTLSSMMQFGIFGVFGSQAAVYIQDVFMIATAGFGLLSSIKSLAALAVEEVAEGGASLASKFGRGIVALLNAANCGVSTAGSIKSLIDNIKNNDKNAAMDQALMLGILSTVIEATAGDKVDKNSTLKIIVMVASMLAMLAVAGADAKLNGGSVEGFMKNYPKLQKMSNIFENVQKFLMTMFSISAVDNSLYSYENTKIQNTMSLYEVTSEQIHLQQEQGFSVLKSMSDSTNMLNQNILQQIQTFTQSLQAYFNSSSRAIETQMQVGLDAISV